MQRPIQVVKITLGEVMLEGGLALKKGEPVVIFAHGSGSSRHSPRNQFVARALNEAGIGTLLFDLLTREEDMDCERRFDIELLTGRLEEVTKWFKRRPEGLKTKIGYFGASTGAAAALKAAAELSKDIGAVVSRGGRPDMAEDALGSVQAPTLLIVGGLDDVVIKLNKKAYGMMKGVKELKIVYGRNRTLRSQARLAVSPHLI